MIDACINETRPAVSFLPVTAVLEMTYRCSHRCLFCSCPWENDKGVFEKGRELDAAEWKDVIRRISSLGVANICFTGGEALLRKDLWDIVQYAYSLKDEKIVCENEKLVLRQEPVKLYLISNGEAVTKNVLQSCKDYKVQLSMSLPGIRSFSGLTGRR